MTVILTISRHTLHEWCLMGTHALTQVRFRLFLAGGLPHPGTSRKRVEKDGVSDVRPRLQRAAPSRQPDETVARRGARPRYCRCHPISAGGAGAGPPVRSTAARRRPGSGRNARRCRDFSVAGRQPHGVCSPDGPAYPCRAPVVSPSDVRIACTVPAGCPGTGPTRWRLTKTHRRHANSHHFLHDNGTIVRVGMARQEDRSWLCKFSL